MKQDWDGCGGEHITRRRGERGGGCGGELNHEGHEGLREWWRVWVVGGPTVAGVGERLSRGGVESAEAGVAQSTRKNQLSMIRLCLLPFCSA